MYERTNWFYCRASVLISIFFCGVSEGIYTHKKNRHPTFLFWALDRGCTKTKHEKTEKKTDSSFILISDQNPNPLWTAVVRSLFQFQHGGGCGSVLLSFRKIEPTGEGTTKASKQSISRVREALLYNNTVLLVCIRGDASRNHRRYRHRTPDRNNALLRGIAAVYWSRNSIITARAWAGGSSAKTIITAAVQ